MKRFYLVLILFAVMSALSSQEENKPLPSTMMECYTLLDEILSVERKEYIKNLDSADDMIEFHFSTGVFIRNNWLRHGNPELIKNINYNNWDVGYDDFSSVILNGYWHYLHGQEYDWRYELEASSRYYRSTEPPLIMPQNVNLKKTKTRYNYSYLFQAEKANEVLHAYYEEKSKLYYIYSLHFGWFILSNDEFEVFSTDPKIRKQMVESKEKFFIERKEIL